jgi:hypothetical protein
MIKFINILLIVDIGVVIFCLISGNREWFINSQIGYISSSLVVIASFISYSNMVKKSLKNNVVVPEDNRDTIEKIEDPYDLYSKDDNEVEKKDSFKEVIKEEKERLKKNKRSFWQVSKDSRASFSIYRLGAYGLLILGFFYLNNNHKLNISSYLLGLSLPPIVMIVTLMRKIR